MITLSTLVMFFYIKCPTSFVLVILLALAFLYVLNKPKSKEVPRKFPPSPPRLPIIGNLHQLGKLPHQCLFKLSQKYGPVMLLQLGRIPTIFISSPEMAKQILKVHDANFCSRPNSPGPNKMTYNSLDIAFSPYSNHWKERRKIFSLELLNSKRSQFLWKSKREEEIRKLIESLSLEASQEKIINLDEKMFQIVGEIMTSVAFGKSYKEHHFKGGCQELKYILKGVTDMLHSFSAEDYFPSTFGRIVDTLSGHRWKLNNSFAILDDYFETILQDHVDRQARSKGDLNDDFVDILVRFSKDPHFHLTTEHIKGIFLLNGFRLYTNDLMLQLMKNIFLGGTDTSANTIVWAMTEMMKNRKVMKKVQAEIRKATGTKDKIEEGDIAELKYLKLVMKETFRLHPVVPLLVPHEAMHDCKIEDGNEYYDIQANTRIFVNAWAIGRDPKIWKIPNEFYPERFEEAEINFKGTDFQLLPFGAGRRICPGIAVSGMTIQFVLANLLNFFDWELPDAMKLKDVSLEEVAGIITHKKIPLSLKPIKYIRHK